MRFKKFVIEGYKAIDHLEISVGNNLIPLIGINESGKTTILQAILSFDKQSDKYGAGAHLNFANIYILDKHECNISADVVIENDSELDEISKKLNLTRGDELLRSLESHRRNGTSIRLTRDLSTKRYSITGMELEPKQNKSLASAIYSLLPFILYFDDFTDRVPEDISFSRADNDRGYRIKIRKLGDWEHILEEVFLRATNRKQTLGSFIKMTERAKRKGLLMDINDVLNREIISTWKEMKKKASRFADDSADLQLSLDYEEKGNDEFLFRFQVVDRANVGGRLFNVVERSKGLQWFFNFQMKLKFNPKYKKDETGAIYLLDEPGSYLHSTAQEDVLSTLKEISETNSILYCTHSQYLLDPDKININQTRIIEFQSAKKYKTGEIKIGAKIIITPFGSAKGSRAQGALTPLFDALHLKTGVFNREMNKVVITEGIIDYYFINMLVKYVSDWKKLRKIQLIPGAGAGHLKELISMAIAWADDYLVLLDSDEAGQEALRKYKLHFGPEEAKHIICYSTPKEESKVLLEKFISAPDKARMKSVTKCTDIKKAIIVLYFLKPEEQLVVFSKLTKATNENLSILKKTLFDFSR